MGADAANEALTPQMNRLRPRLYLITPPQFEPHAFAALLAATLVAGDVACLQVRLKKENGEAVDDALMSEAIAAIKPVTQAHEVALLINDRPDLAKAFDCDGTHIGQQDMAYDKARTILGDDKIIGVTCHNSRNLAMLAGDAGADYVAFGAFYPTPTKQAAAAAELDILAWWQEVMTLPCVAIGGITPDNAAPLAMAGADFIAVSSGVWHHGDGAVAAVKAFNAVFDTTHKKLSAQ